MILSPVQNKAVMDTQWIQKRPRLSQHFGLNPQIYSQFGLKGHNGTDFAIPTGTPIYAPMDGEVKVKDDGVRGYGLHVRIRSPYKDAEIVLGHLSTANVTNGSKINMGEIIGYSGNTGFSTGPHLHMGYRKLKPGKQNKVWEWQVFDYSNGYYGYIDVIDWTLTWKGTYINFNL